MVEATLLAKDLGLTEQELAALIRVHRRLEDGTIAFDQQSPERIRLRFNMIQPLREYSCGTVGCIAGWIAYDLANGLIEKARDGVDALLKRAEEVGHGSGLYQLFFPDQDVQTDWSLITPAQAVRAIENFLTLGKPAWDDVLSQDVA